MPQLWVGLGNPEPRMAMNRHNVGFMAIDAIAETHGFSPWRKAYKGLFAEGRIGGERIFALKPLTYMNLSGESVQAASAFYKIELDQIVVFHDELDLEPGKVRVKKGGGAAGHNGIRSIDQCMGSPDYWRVRLGIGHPGSKAMVHGYVLGNFTSEDTDWLSDLLGEIAAQAPDLAKGRREDFASRVAGNLAPKGGGKA